MLLIMNERENMKELESIKNKIAEKTKENAEEIAKINKELEKLEAKKTELYKELEESEKAGNYERFRETQKKITELQFLLDFQNRKKAAALQPLTSREVYNEDSKRLFAELDQITEKANKDIEDLLSKAEKIYIDTNKTIDEANKVMEDYVNELLKEHYTAMEKMANRTAVNNYRKYVNIIEQCQKITNKAYR